MNQNQNQNEEARTAYFISELEKHADGGYRALIATEGEIGFRRTEWNWGADKKMAQQTCNMYNAAQHIDFKTAAIIQLRSMRQS